MVTGSHRIHHSGAWTRSLVAVVNGFIARVQNMDMTTCLHIDKVTPCRHTKDIHPSLSSHCLDLMT